MYRHEKNIMREKRITVGDSYMEVDIIPRNLEDERTRSGRSRKRKEKVTAPAQSNLNDKNARRYLVELGNGNFDENDIYLTLTYEDLSRPKTIQEAEKNVTNFLRRLKAKRKRNKLDSLKYILVTEYVQNEDGEFTKKIHHHLIINGGISRDELESMWSIKVPGQKKRKVLGYANARRLQPDESLVGNGIERLMNYLSKDPKGKKRWSSSRNLKRPIMRKNDSKYYTSTIKKAHKSPDMGMSLFKKKYPNYEIVDNIKWEYNEMTGWHVYLKMWKKSTERVI
ncbi:Phage-like protein [Paucilactobacillus oligofermentans DSM 15707 = LMG 22743]|nr:Phage-like protein [Paucilactobacillus oligofermentans DSM 15707 = LMG 22743]